jgi:hypothetical protein
MRRKKLEQRNALAKKRKSRSFAPLRMTSHGSGMGIGCFKEKNGKYKED